MTVDTDYLSVADYITYGVPTATPDLVAVASNVIDAYLERPEGLLWTPAPSGMPLCMTRQQATSLRTLNTNISAGSNVTINLSNGPLLIPGAVIVLNRTGANAESCKVGSVIDGTNVVLETVLQAHSVGETIETGLVIEELLSLPKGRTVATLSKGPITQIYSLMGRISYTRRGRENAAGGISDYSMIAVSSLFGGAPIWQNISISPGNVDMYTNQVWCPVGIMMAPFSEILVSYVAGYQTTALPSTFKQAVANVVQALIESPASAAIKRFKAGETEIERFIPTLISQDTELLLAPFSGRSYA